METFKTLAWTARPKPPLGVAPWDHNRRWFRYYVTFQIEKVIWRFRNWRWERRTGGKQNWCW